MNLPYLIATVRRYVKQTIAVLVLVTAIATAIGTTLDTAAPPAPVVAPALTPAPAENPAAPGKVGALPAATSDELPGVDEATERAIARENAAVDAGTYDTSGVLRGGATAEGAHRSCPTNMNGGVRPLSKIKLGVIHVTVSRNVKGLADGNALCGFFRNVKASPTWTVDNEGNSWENVALNRVPWTQAWFNSSSCSIEFIGSTGRPGEGAAEWTTAQYTEGARLIARCFQLVGIKAVRAIVRGDTIVKAGVITHQELGALGGGHSDPGPLFNMDLFMALLRKTMSPTTSVDRVTCRKLNWWRSHGRKGGKQLANAIRRREAMKARGVRCLTTGPVRA